MLSRTQDPSPRTGERAPLVPQRLARLEHVGHAGLGHLLSRQADEDFSLEVQQVLLVDGLLAAAAAATRQNVGQAVGNMRVVLRDLACSL